jgi:DNA repair protein RadC
MTYELVRAAATLGLKVHDHLIIGKGGYFSFKSSGLLDKDKLQ